MNIDDKIAELKASIESCERVCEAVPTGTIRDAALRKAEDCKQMVEWLEDYKRLSSSEKNEQVDINKQRYADNRTKCASLRFRWRYLYHIFTP